MRPEQPYYNQYQKQDDSFSTKEILKYSFIGLLTIGGSFFIGRSLVRTAIKNKEQKKAATEGTPQDYAQRLKMAFENDNWFGWGTDETAIRRVLTGMPSREVFAQTMTAYQRMFNRSLMKDMKEDLSSNEYSEMMAIINAKPERLGRGQVAVIGMQQYASWAKRLKAAFQETNLFIFGGTDEAAVEAVFIEFPTQAAFFETAKEYKRLYNDDLAADLRDELTFGEFIAMMKILKDKPVN